MFVSENQNSRSISTFKQSTATTCPSDNFKEATEYADKCIEFEDGKYTTHFSWKSEYRETPANFNTVQNMTRAIIIRLAKDPPMLAMFSRLIEDQLKRKFIQKVPAAGLAKNCHYIPYHYV